MLHDLRMHFASILDFQLSDTKYLAEPWKLSPAPFPLYNCPWAKARLLIASMTAPGLPGSILGADI